MNIGKLKSFITSKLEKELPEYISYHDVQHTIDVLNTCNAYIRRMKIAEKDAFLLRTAALLHDTGFLWGFENHEEKGMAYTRKILPDWGYSNRDIDIVCKLIKATAIPQKPQNTLEEILCDADLDYLGTDKFYKIGEKLYREFMHFQIVKNREDWDRLQVKFLQSHSYFTAFAKKHREPVKQKYINEIILKHGWNSL